MKLISILLLLIAFQGTAPLATAAITDTAVSNESEFLPPEQAFRAKLTTDADGTVHALFTPAPGYYLYRERIAFQVKSPAGVRVTKVDMPAGDMKEDPNFGKLEVYHQPFTAVVHLAGPGGPVELETSFQGCSEKGLCYAPMQHQARLDVPGSRASSIAVAAAMPDAGTAQGVVPDGAEASDMDRIASLFKGGSFWVVLASFFGFGLLLSFTPCVFPMIPILSGIIVGQGGEITRGRALTLSTAYVLGMAITYSAAGVAAGLSGSLLSTALQNPWVLGSFALVFVLLSLSMFGFYELQLPGFLQSRLSEKSNSVQGGNFAGVFVMGALSALIVGPCVAAPLAGALLYIGQTHNVVLGGSALFAMAMGMGVPLLLVGTSAGALLPRAGMWMEAVKKFFGVLLLAVAIWLVTPVLPPAAPMLLWAALLIGSAMFLRALDPLPVEAGGFQRMFKAVGVLSLLLGSALVLGALSGGRDVLQPLAGLRAPVGSPMTGTAVAAGNSLKFERVASVQEMERRIKEAAGRPVMLDFYADWCVSCKEMEHLTFTDPKVRDHLQNAVLLQADVTANKDEHKALLRRFGLFGPPGIVFFDPKGQELKNLQVIGFQPPEKFLTSLKRLM